MCVWGFLGGGVTEVCAGVVSVSLCVGNGPLHAAERVLHLLRCCLISTLHWSHHHKHTGYGYQGGYPPNPYGPYAGPTGMMDPYAAAGYGAPNPFGHNPYAGVWVMYVYVGYVCWLMAVWGSNPGGWLTLNAADAGGLCLELL